MIISHVRLFTVISHVTIIADSALCFIAILAAIDGVMGQYFLYNKQNNTRMRQMIAIIILFYYNDVSMLLASFSS